MINVKWPISILVICNASDWWKVLGSVSIARLLSVAQFTFISLWFIYNVMVNVFTGESLLTIKQWPLEVKRHLFNKNGALSGFLVVGRIRKGRRENSEILGHKRTMMPSASKVSRKFAGSRNYIWKFTADLYYENPRS